MDESHDDQNFRSKIAKIWSIICEFCCQKYPIPTTIVILFFFLYLFFPLIFKLLIISFPLVGFSLLVHRVLSGNNQQKVIKNVKQDEDRRRKFAKSRRSFKSVYNDRSRLNRRNTLNKNDDFIDSNVDDKDNIFIKSLHELLSDKKSKDVANFEFIAGKGEGSSSNGKIKNGHPQVVDKNDPEDDDKPKDQKIVRWTEDDQKNAMELGLTEAERNKRLEGLMVRRRSRKNLGFEEKGSTENGQNVKISSVKTTKINPFLENNSGGKKSPGSAPSFLKTTSNPFDIPYDPHEEKLDLTGDNFDEEFTLVQPKEPVFCRHQSFSLGALPHSVIAHDKHERYYKDLSNKQKSTIGFEISSLDNEGINSNHPKEEGETSGRAILQEEDGNEIKPQEIDSYNERKADINFFYGSNKRIHHAVSHSMVSDMQVELSDEETPPTLDDLDIEKERESLSNSSTAQTDSNNHTQESHGLTEEAVGQASVGSTSPKSVLQHEFSVDPASSNNFINEIQQSDNHTRELDSLDNQTNNSEEHSFRDRDIDNLQDQNVSQL